MLNSHEDKLTVQYQSWRKTSRISPRFLGLGAIVLVFLFSATLYVGLVYKTVTKPSAHIFVIGPTVKAASIHPEEDCWIDLPRLFSATSAKRTAQELSSHPNCVYEHVISPEKFIEELKKRSFRGSPLIIYYSGILSVASDKAAVLDSSKQAGMPTHATEICHLIEAIKGCDASIGIVVLDLSMPDLKGPLSLAASHSFDQAQMQIDGALRNAGRVPTAIQLSINRMPRWHELGLPSDLTWERPILPQQSECSSQFIAAVEFFSRKQKTEVHAFQETLSKRVSSEQKRTVYQAQSEWLCGPDWPLNDLLISFSTWNKFPETDEKPLANDDIVTESLPPKVAFRKTLEDYQNLLKRTRERNVDEGLPWISIPPPQTYTSLHPVAYSFLEKNYFLLRTAYELAPNSLNQEGMQLVVQSLRDAWDSKSYTDRVPKWLTSYFMDRVDSRGPQINSIVSRAVLSSYGLAAPLKKSEIEWLAKLRELLESPSPTNNPLHMGLLELSADQQSDFFEYRWIETVLGREGLETTMLTELIRAKLMELRLTSDPLITQQFGSKIVEASQLLIATERLLFDKSEPDWSKKGMHSLRLVQAKLDACYSEFLEFRSQQTKSIASYYSEILNLEYFSFPAPQLKPDGDVASDEEVLKRYRNVWTEFHFKSNNAESNVSRENDRKADWHSGKSFSSLTSTKFDFVSQAMKIYQHFGDELNRDHSTDTLSQPNAKNATRSSSFLIAKHEFHNECNLHSFDPKRMIETLASFNLQRISNAAQGAQTWEADLLASSSTSWYKVATQFASEQTLDRVVKSFDNTIRIEAPLKLDFSTKDQVEGVIGIQLESTKHSQAFVSSEYDESRLQLLFGGKMLPNGTSLPLQIWDGHIRPASFPISVRKRNSLTVKSPVIFYVTHGGQKRRVVLESEKLLPPMLSVGLQNESQEFDQIASDFGSDHGHVLEPVFAANQKNQMRIVTKYLDFHEAVISHRVLLNQSDRTFPLHGVLDQSKAMQALYSFGVMPVAAITIPRLYKPGQMETVVFLPDSNFANLSDRSFRELILESTNETTKHVQYTIVKTKAINPRQFIHASVTNHSGSQMLEVVFSSAHESDFPITGVNAQCELWDLGAGRLLATPQCVLDSSLNKKSIRISTAASMSRNLLVSIAIDNWRSAFVFEIDRDRSGNYEPESSFVGATIRIAGDSNVIGTDATHVPMEMDLCINESTFEASRDRIHIGIDQNLDRTLDGESVVEVRDTKSHQTVFHGVNAKGDMILESLIGSIQASIPIEFEWNRKGAILAKVIRSGETIYSHGPQLIFDKKKPEIRSVQVQSAGPILLGKPLTIEVVTDDADLSGVDLVEGGWSVTGETEFHDRMTMVPALSNQSNRWILTLPTATILPGYNTLLIRSRDRAGNISETYSLNIAITAEAAYQQQIASAVTIVRGRLISDYKLMPGAKLTLGLEVEQKIDKQSESPAANSELEVIATTVSDERGTFLFRGIPSGKYIVESNVILRGTRLVQRTPIVVDALVGPADCSITVGEKK
jgi:hypothetical protein